MTHLCRFDTADHLRGKARTYDTVKAAALEAGRFSIFEATENERNASMFDQLHHDSEVEIFDLPYPWIGVKRRGTD